MTHDHGQRPRRSTYRQLDYWARTGLVEPSVRAAHGSGSDGLYSFNDILVLKAIKRLLDTGISLQQIRVAVRHLRDRGTEDLAGVTLMSDGISVYECISPEEVVDLLEGGAGVFAIALGRVWNEVAVSSGNCPRCAVRPGMTIVQAIAGMRQARSRSAGPELYRRRREHPADDTVSATVFPREHQCDFWETIEGQL